MFGYVLFDVRSEGENAALQLVLTREPSFAEPKVGILKQSWGLPATDIVRKQY